MNVLRASVVATLGLAAAMASAQGASLSVEDRLQKLEAEQTAMKQQQADLQRQLAERDARIKQLELYGITSQIYGDEDAGFGDSSEYGVGMNWYPFPTHNHRLNLQLLDVNKSPVSSTFGYYTGGQDGWTLASSFSVFF